MPRQKSKPRPRWQIALLSVFHILVAFVLTSFFADLSAQTYNALGNNGLYYIVGGIAVTIGQLYLYWQYQRYLRDNGPQPRYIEWPIKGIIFGLLFWGLTALVVSSIYTPLEGSRLATAFIVVMALAATELIRRKTRPDAVRKRHDVQEDALLTEQHLRLADVDYNEAEESDAISKDDALVHMR